MKMMPIVRASYLEGALKKKPIEILSENGEEKKNLINSKSN